MCRRDCMNYQVKIYELNEHVVNDDPVKKWEENFISYLNEHCNVITPEIIPYQSNKITLSPFTGDPFIWIGNNDQIIQFLNRLKKSGIDIISNCAYFWIITDDPQKVKEHEILSTIKRDSFCLTFKTPAGNLISKTLHYLVYCPELVGLSNQLHDVRKDIISIASGSMGPGAPVLINGPTGVGKELVANYLFENSPRNPGKLNPKKQHQCPKAFLKMASRVFYSSNIALSQLYGSIAGLTDIKNSKGVEGVLYNNRFGCIFFDDVDTAPLDIQEALLRLTATEEYLPFEFYRYGGEGSKSELRQTYAWLFFATNRSIKELIEKGIFRDDFVRRFKNRIISIPALKYRPADLPAIIFHIWEQISPKHSYILSDKIVNEISVNILKAFTNIQKEKIDEIQNAIKALLPNARINTKALTDKLHTILYSIIPDYAKKIETITFENLFIQNLETICGRLFDIDDIEWLCSQELEWKGNVRDIYSLLLSCFHHSENKNFDTLKNILEFILYENKDNESATGYDTFSQQLLALFNKKETRLISDSDLVSAINHFLAVLNEQGRKKFVEFINTDLNPPNSIEIKTYTEKDINSIIDQIPFKRNKKRLLLVIIILYTIHHKTIVYESELLLILNLNQKNTLVYQILTGLVNLDILKRKQNKGYVIDDDLFF